MTGNLPPGVTPSDIDDAYGPSIEPHDHEWRLADAPAVVFEDGAAIVTYECTFVEITDSYHSSRHDEVYYEEGASCDEQRLLRLETDAPDRAVEAIEVAFHNRDVAASELIDTMSVPPELPAQLDDDDIAIVASTDDAQVTYNR